MQVYLYPNKRSIKLYSTLKVTKKRVKCVQLMAIARINDTNSKDTRVKSAINQQE